ncbi:MAG TPA: alpha-ketoglutarate-dependent dioxygenase AlkB [Caulobacteraceae bacterium]|nr:alpha-ketoglutarate-dependent dioxygenase AlkB [Caulobacteraceae bacterium]
MEFNGFRLYPAALDALAQTRLAALATAAAAAAPFYRPLTPWGKPMSVEQTSFGPLGWTTDASGYRYEARHPVTGQPWPPMPPELLAIWKTYGGPGPAPDSCLVNLYRGEARMGLHVDSDEDALEAPVVSISLGDTAVFRLGGRRRQDPTRTVRLNSGDVCVLAGASRHAYHGIDRILAGSSQLVPGGGRINLTLRRARA